LKRAAALLALGLTACATDHAEPRIEIREVKVPVPVTCVPAALPAAPTYPDTDEALRAAKGPADRLALIVAGRLLRIQRQAETEPVIAGCR